MSSRQIKNTRLFYNDEKNLIIYQALSAEDFKELFMACLTYKVGSDVKITDFSSPSLYGLFMMYKDKIDYNETKWLNSAIASRENGKKGGRPKKNVESENNPDLSTSNIPDDNLYTPEVESSSNGLKMPVNEEFDLQSKSADKEEHIELRNLPNNPTILITDEEKYGSDVMDLIEDNPEIITALKSVVEYNSGDINKEYQAKMANTKIDQIVRSTNNDNNFIRRVENFCADYMKEYKEHKESNNYI